MNLREEIGPKVKHKLPKLGHKFHHVKTIDDISNIHERTLLCIRHDPNHDVYNCYFLADVTTSHEHIDYGWVNISYGHNDDTIKPILTHRTRRDAIDYVHQVDEIVLLVAYDEDDNDRLDTMQYLIQHRRELYHNERSKRTVSHSE